MDTKPDTIKISVQEREEIHADHAEIFVTVKGSSAFAGDEALKKAREVTQLVSELTKSGLTSEDIHLNGISIESSGANLLKSSKATYRLKILCEKLEIIPGLIDILATQKETSLDRIAWKYPEETYRPRLLELAISRATFKAEKISSLLGVKLLGVYDFIENFLDEESPLPAFQVQPVYRSSGFAANASPSLGLDIHHTKTVQENIEIWYRVSAF